MSRTSPVPMFTVLRNTASRTAVKVRSLTIMVRRAAFRSTKRSSMLASAPATFTAWVAAKVSPRYPVMASVAVRASSRYRRTSPPVRFDTTATMTTGIEMTSVITGSIDHRSQNDTVPATSAPMRSTEMSNGSMTCSTSSRKRDTISPGVSSSAAAPGSSNTRTRRFLRTVAAARNSNDPWFLMPRKINAERPAA